MTYQHQTSIKTVAILTRGEALGAILQMVLSQHKHLQVRVFSNKDALMSYMRITPIDVLICELGAGPDGATHLVPKLLALNNDGHPLQTIALATESNVPTKAICERSGIDEVVFKPMSPRYLEERVLARLSDGYGARPSARMARKAQDYEGADRRRIRPSRSPKLRHRLPHNVIALFGVAPTDGR